MVINTVVEHVSVIWLVHGLEQDYRYVRIGLVGVGDLRAVTGIRHSD